MFFDRIHNIEGSDNMYQAGLVLEGGCQRDGQEVWNPDF